MRCEIGLSEGGDAGRGGLTTALARPGETRDVQNMGCVAAEIESALRDAHGVPQDGARAAGAAMAAFEHRRDALEGRVAALGRSIALTKAVCWPGLLVNTAVAITVFAS